MGSLPHIVDDFMGVFQVYSDGSVRRPSLTDMGIHIPVIDDNSVDFKEVIFDETHNLPLRLYKPKSASGDSKLPVLFFFHGGGFCFASCTWPNSHNCCLRLSSVLHALVVAPDYRLAPEHKLPAGIEDAVSAVEWLRREALVSESGGGEEWLGGGKVGFDRVFVMGDSSGGNMAHHLAVRQAAGQDVAAPLRVCGYVLLAPYFTGVERTKSEEGPREAWLTLEILDGLLEFAMPGETRDHPLMNPFGPNSPNLEKVAFDPIMVMAGGKELLRDRAEIYSRKLKELGKKIEYVEIEGEEHGFLQNDPYSKVSNEALQAIKTFMIENSN